MDEARIFKSEQWHIKRNKNILEETPQVHSLYGQNIFILLQLFLIPIINCASLYWCSYLNFWQIIIVTGTLGAFCNMRAFNVMHEICHDLVSSSLNKHKILKFLAMMLVQIPMLGSFYSYYRWAHLSHHAHLGQQSLDEAISLLKKFKNGDGDLLVQFLAFRKHKNELAKNSWMQTPCKRCLYFGFFMPIKMVLFDIFTLFIVLPARMVSLFKLFSAGSSGLSAQELKYQRDNTILSITDKLFSIFVIFAVTYFFGWRGLCYLLFSKLFYWGFLFHPLLTYWLSVHHGHVTADGCQPTTSTYGLIMAIFCGGVEYHVEHHDFIKIPVKNLKLLHKYANESYKNIVYYKNFIEVFKEIFSNKQGTWIYGCQNYTKSPQ